MGNPLDLGTRLWLGVIVVAVVAVGYRATRPRSALAATGTDVG